MTNEELKRKWQELHENPELRKALRPEIRDSWERSYQYGINPKMFQNSYIFTEYELKQAQEESHYLIEMALPVMENLYEFVAGTGFVVALGDAKNTCILKVIGDDESLKFAQNGRLIEGSIWEERLVGTNAGALSIDLVKPFSVLGYEHFCLFSHVAACSTAPIIDQGQIVGQLGLMAPFNKVSKHTLGMVVASTMHIQSKMILERARKYNEIMMDTMQEGVLVVDINGYITFMNENCARILKQSSQKVIGCKSYELFSNENQFFIDMIRKGHKITDETFILTIANNKIRCNITSLPIQHSDPFYGGHVIIIREGKQVSRMVRNWIGGKAKINFDNIIGNNTRFKQVINTAKTAASSSSNVLILGESGTGKDVIAQSMHNASPRKNNPFLAINCAALPRELLASELFGYEDGAFTGAKKGGNIGKFELADQGTIFLDEIGDMPLDMQASLLRVIEEKSITRLGGNKLIPVNVRIIAATNKNLESEIERNRFRRDLYYRLAIIKMTIPPLRERPDDILLLVNHFAKSISKRFGKPEMTFTPKVIEAFLNYDWPGNVRELQNVLEGAVQLAPSNEITYDLINEYLQQKNFNFHSPVEKTDNQTVADVEKKMIKEYLETHKFNKTKTAQALGISRRTLYRRLKEYDIL